MADGSESRSRSGSLGRLFRFGVVGLSGVVVTGTMRPLIFIDGATPAVINKSDAPFSTMIFNSLSMSMLLSALLSSASPLEVFREAGFFSSIFPGNNTLVD